MSLSSKKKAFWFGLGTILFFIILAIPRTSYAAGCTGTGACYWVGGTGNWNNPAFWATTSGGATTGGLPSITDDCIFDANSGGGTSTVNVTTSCNSISFNGAAHNSDYTGTLTSGGAIYASGSLEFSASMTRSYTGTITMSGESGTYTIISNGTTGAENITFKGKTTGTYQFKDNYTSTGTLNLTSGTLDAADGGANHDISIKAFSSTNSNTRTLTMGSGIWTLTGNSAAIWDTTTDTVMTITGSGRIVANYSGSTGTRTINVGPKNRVPDLYVTAGTDILNFNRTSALFSSMDFTGFTGDLSRFSIPRLTGSVTFGPNMTLSGNTGFTASGSVTFGSGMTRTNTGTITLNGSGTQIITSNGTTGAEGLTIGQTGVSPAVQLADTYNSTGAMVLTTGTFDANDKDVTIKSLSSTNANTRTLTMGSGTWTLTGGSATLWDTSTDSAMTLTSSGHIVANYSGGTGTRTINSGYKNRLPNVYVTAGSDTVNFNHTNGLFSSIDMTGFTGTVAVLASPRLTGDITFGSDMTWTGTTAFVASGSVTFGSGMTRTSIGTAYLNGSGTQTITSNGSTGTENLVIGITGTSPTVQLADAYTTTGALTLTYGTLNANNKNITIGSFSSNNTNTRTLTMGSGTWTLTGSGTVWYPNATNLTFNAGSSTIIINDSSATDKSFLGRSLTYGAVTLSGTGTGIFTISDSNTFTTFTLENPPHTLKFVGGTTNTACTWNLSGSDTSSNTITSTNTTPYALSSSCTTPTITNATVSYLTAYPNGWGKGNGFVDDGNNTGLVDAATGAGICSGGVETGVVINGGLASPSSAKIYLNNLPIKPNTPYTLNCGSSAVVTGVLSGYKKSVAGECAPNGQVIISRDDIKQCLVVFDYSGTPTPVPAPSPTPSISTGPTPSVSSAPKYSPTPSPLPFIIPIKSTYPTPTVIPTPTPRFYSSPLPSVQVVPFVTVIPQETSLPGAIIPSFSPLPNNVIIPSGLIPEPNLQSPVNNLIRVIQVIIQPIRSFFQSLF